MKSAEILSQFEEDLVADKNPTPAEYEERYGPIDAETKDLMEVMMGLVLLGEEAQLPPGFEERQRKLARDLIARKKAEDMVKHWQGGEKAVKEGNYTKAREHYQRLLTFVQYIKDESWIAFASSRLGNIASALDDKEKTLEYHQSARDLYRKLGMKRELAISLHNLAIEYLAKKDYPRARELYQEAIELNEELGATFALAHEYLNLGAAEKYLGNTAGAQEYYRTSLDIFSSRQDPNGTGMAEYNLGELVDDPAESIRFYQAALGHFREAGNQQLLAQSAGSLAVRYLSQGDNTKAKQMFKTAMEALKSKEPRAKSIESRLRREAAIAQIPDEARQDPARLLRFLLDREAEETWSVKREV